MVILVVLRSAGLARYFEPSLRILAERGHLIHLAFPGGKKGGNLGDWVRQYAHPLPGQAPPSDDQEGLFHVTELAKIYPNVSWGPIRRGRGDQWEEILFGLRASQDYLRYFEPEYINAAALRDRTMLKGVPAFFAAMMRTRLGRTKLARRTVAALLSACERAIPVSAAAVDDILEIMPNVVLVSRLVDYGSPQVDYVRAAQHLGIPVGLPVASWDNLTNKGLIRVLPDFLTVWNEYQKREAIELHGMREDRVWVTGSQPFDVWFDREPSTSRDEFCSRFAFDPEKSLIVYLCSSNSIAGDEVHLVRRWLDAVRAHEDELVQQANVIVRPHPKHAKQWADVDLSEFGAVEIWPRAGEIAVTDDQRNDFFDTLYHSGAIVGLNTSAQIEAAIIGRPVLILLDKTEQTVRAGTLETLHFRYLGDPELGIGIVAESTGEHLKQLGKALREPDQERRRRFLKDFVRPHGVDKPAAPFLADAIERGATARTRAKLSITPLTFFLRMLLLVCRPSLLKAVRKRATADEAEPSRQPALEPGAQRGEVGAGG